MRSTAFLLTALALWTLPSALAGQGALTLLTAFDRPPDASTVEWMEQEAGALFSDAGLTLSWQLRQHDPFEGVGPLVSVRFHGKCLLEPASLSSPAPGPMAWVQSQDGEIRSFIDVDCDRTAAMVWQVRGTLPLPLATRAFGRALGRVVAHELYHYMTQSALHHPSELFSQAMTSRDLTLPQVRFETGEIEALRRGMRRLGTAPRAPCRHTATD